MLLSTSKRNVMFMHYKIIYIVMKNLYFFYVIFQKFKKDATMRL